VSATLPHRRLLAALPRIAGLVALGILLAGCGSRVGSDTARDVRSAYSPTVTTPRLICPRSVIEGPVQMSRVARAAERLIPRVYRGEYIRGRVIEDVRWLTDNGADRGYAKFRRAAIQTCGRRVADASWAVTIAFPYVHMPASRNVAFVVRTRRGWRMYRPPGAVEYRLLPSTLLPPPYG
jgi:hypothetical protein